jgi:hypothetical protein
VSTTVQVDPAAPSRLGTLAAPVACGCCLLAGAAYVATADPSGRGGFLPCPFRTLTGWWCPGCGLTRATHHLFRGDIAQALRYNVFVVLVFVAVMGSWLAWTLKAMGQPVLHHRITPVAGARWLLSGAIAVVVAFAVARNLPGVDGLRG